MNIENLNLKHNPFEHLTPNQRTSTYWAGEKDIMQIIESIYINSFDKSSRNVILNWGHFGSGKTFTAYYFKNKKFENIENNQIINIYTRTPKDGIKITQQIFRDILDGISLRKLKYYINEVLSEIGEDKLFDYIYEKINSEEFTNAIINLGKESQLDTQFELMKKYIFGTISANELNILGLIRKLESDSDYRKFLAGIILAITATKKPKRVFLWIDEMEDLIYYTSKQYKEFAQTIRDLADTADEKFTIFMNFTFSESEEENIRLLIGEALWTRVNQKIHFKNFGLEQTIEYCKDLLKNSQIDTTKGDFSPFDKEVIYKLFDKPMNPREINRNLNDLIQFALKQEFNLINIELLEKYKKIGQL